ncbi:FCD domain-containing protein [Streptomyces sp. NPDC047028]|uniref:FadR/GntR family transcriptional regulator n=1 Tax=Streptomyces sp. NPDC047028 TaxID=3155793 RepID=UPI0033C91735
MEAALPRETVVEAAQDQICADILTGRHAIGQLLPPERVLAGRFGITRTTLKHALSRLIQAGLLETRHGAGTRVRNYLHVGGADLLPLLVRHCPSWLKEIFEVRHSIGMLIAQQAAMHATDDDISRLLQLLQEIRTAPSPGAVQLADAEVHRTLAQATGNRVYLLLTNTLFSAYLPVRDRFAAPFTDPSTAYERLAPLIAAVRNRDPVAAQHHASAYLTQTQMIMLDGLENS